MESLEFRKSKAIGTNEEIRVKNTLESRGLKVIDLTDSEEFRKKDIDFLVQKGNEEAFIEVKADRRMGDTGNICVELVTNIKNKSEGWLSYCEADYIFYCDSQNDCCYCFLLDDLRQYFKTLRREIVEKRVNEQNKSRIIALVNLKAFKDFLERNNLYFQVLNLGVN